MTGQLSYNEFMSEFTQETTKVTHEMFFDQKTITIGIWRGKRVALKCGIGMESELIIMQKIGYHPNIIQLIANVCDDQDGSFILMEGIKDGFTLDNYCAWSWTQVPLSIRGCILLIRQLASALLHLHQLGIIHHDIKSTNVLVDISGKDPTLKLCDFGLSEIVDENGKGREDYREAGTYNSMAPEQLSGNEPITTKIDIYSFSSLCNGILLKGRDLDKIKWFIPIKLSDIIAKCCKRDPKERPSINEVIDILDELLPNLETEETYSSQVSQLYQLCVQHKFSVPKELESLYNESCKFTMDMTCD